MVCHVVVCKVVNQRMATRRERRQLAHVTIISTSCPVSLLDTLLVNVWTLEGAQDNVLIQLYYIVHLQSRHCLCGCCCSISSMSLIKRSSSLSLSLSIPVWMTSDSFTFHLDAWVVKMVGRLLPACSFFWAYPPPIVFRGLQGRGALCVMTIKDNRIFTRCLVMCV